MERDGKFGEKYLDAVSYIEMNPIDIERLGISDRCRVEGKYGHIVLPVKASDSVQEGTVFIPMGPWANILVDPETESTGMPKLKGVDVLILPTEEEITSLKDILRRYGVKEFDIQPIDRPLKAGETCIVKDVVCTFCGELCDYLEISLEGERIKRVKGGCAISNAKLLNYHRHRILKPMIRSDDGKLREATLEEAIEKTIEILSKSKYPLLYGWSNTSTQATEIGIELAEVLGGVIDNTTVMCHGPTALAAQEVGTARATLGLVKHFVDVIIFWGSNAVHAHPNHFARWIIPEGKIVKGRKERKIIVIDVRKTATAKQADIFIQIEPEKDFELVTALRMLLKDIEIETDNVAGVSLDKLYELIEIMKTARYGAFFIGMGLTMTGAKFRTIQELIKLAHDLNEWTRFVMIPMRGHYNVTGSNEAMLWSSGYPYSIEFSRKFPRMIPGFTTTPDLLMHGEVDAALIIASDPVAHFPQKAIEHLSKIPVIVIDPKWSLTTTIADVIIPTTMMGIESEGTAYRMDGVAIRLRKIVEPPEGVPTDLEILKKILEGVMKERGLM